MEPSADRTTEVQRHAATDSQTSAASNVLDREYLEARAKLLELAAFFDRLDRAGDSADSDLRVQRLRAAAELILDSAGNRAEALLLHFSRSYDTNWRQTLQMQR